MQSGHKKELDFEINLLPVISVLAVCICFLLSTAVWVLIGSVELKQATGSVGILTDRTPLVVVSLSDSTVEVQLKNTMSNHKVVWNTSAANVGSNLSEDIASLKGSVKGLDAAIVLSAKTVPYQKIVSTLELLKSQGFAQVGISPL